MHVVHLLGSDYSLWVSHWDNRAPLVSVGDGFWLSVGDENQCLSKHISKVWCEYYIGCSGSVLKCG